MKKLSAIQCMLACLHLVFPVAWWMCVCVYVCVFGWLQSLWSKEQESVYHLFEIGIEDSTSFIVSLWWAALCEGKAFSLTQNSHLQSHSAIFNVWPQKHILQPLQVCVHTLFITVEGIPIPDSLLHLEKTAQHSTNSSSTRAILGGRWNQTLQK
jgi:hypothetical protein